ncbi:MAG: glycerol-3-phosphate 1-O-acyltransferase PlsY [Bryobacteraceae bacterium]|nr:glycerol-3-phosphate 1-O-acyltransferase PlsY [Bryobacteraceae bacterium]MCX7605440.1 glycerol-3-phosphate 1-O-acyltransferase PlsY [Bryobacteraceae bacterium]
MTEKFLLLAAAYLLGGIPFGYLIVKLRTGRDVRTMGSGNIGATNVLRTTGRGWGLLTLALDIAKGWAACALMDRFGGGSPEWIAAAGVAVVLGHAWPVYLRFQGGKAVASFVGVALHLAPWALAAVAAVFLIAVAATRYVSLGSILGAALFPFAVWLLYHPGPVVLSAVAFSSAFIIWRHRSNIQRLLSGTENAISLRRKK